MPLYRVTWESDIEADTHEEAARKAWADMRRPDSIANAFDVSDGKETVHIDLEAIDHIDDEEPPAMEMATAADLARLYNCRTDYAPIKAGEYTGLTLGGCLTQTDLSGSWTLGGQAVADAEFFTVYGTLPDGEAEAVTDAGTAADALAVAAELSRLHDLAVTLAPTLAPAP